MGLLVVAFVIYAFALTGYTQSNDDVSTNIILKTLDDDLMDGPTVKIPQGNIVGTYKKSYFGRRFAAFEGIPYAEPPVANLRFEAPQPARGWDGTLVANNSYSCLCFIPFPVIYGVHGTEDCLYVYVYVPREKIKENENLDVIVHIHGGAFMMGSPESLAGPKYIMDKDVVYVSFNYRLGVLGFLSTEDDVVPGNNGLKDQSLALKWIRDNIRYFGGNPDSVTLTGLSAGGSSVHYHYLSPFSKGLFHRGFSQSGTALQCWALVQNPLENAQIVARNLSCPLSTTREMIECMKEKDPKSIIWAIRHVFAFWEAIPFAPFAPVIEKGGDHPFISEHPYKLLERGEVYDVPWITSNTIEEGIYPTGFFLMLDKLKDINENWNEVMLYSLNLHDSIDKEDEGIILKKIRQFYLANEKITTENVYALVQMFTDRMFTVDAEKALRLHAKASRSPVYYYLFAYLLQMSNFFPMKKGVGHGDDGKMLFEMIFTPSQLEKNDEEMMKDFTEFIANYAKTGVPQFENQIWSNVDPTSEKLDYLYIQGPHNISMRKIRTLGASDFWNSLTIHELEKFKEKARSCAALCDNFITFIVVIMFTCDVFP